MSSKRFLVIFCFFISSTCFGQFNNLKFENLDTYNGLSSSTCSEIFQDKEGFLWFGTIDGLNKYNGHEFEIFRSELNNQKTISNNRINAIEEDSEGNLWIGTNNGLNLYNKQTNAFTRISLYSQLSLANSSQKIINDLLFDDTTQKLWVATNNGIVKIALGDHSANTKNYEYSYYLKDQTNPNSLDDNIVNVILKDRDKKIWIGTNGQNLNKYNPVKDNFERVRIENQRPYELNHKPKKVFIDADGDFWIGNDLSNLVLWKRKENEFKHVSLVNRTIPIHDIFQDRNGLFWVSSDAFGLYLFSKGKGQITLEKHIESNISDPFSLPNNKPAKIFEDKKGIYWIGSYDKGVSKLDPTNYSFGHYYYQANNPKGLNEKIVQSVLEDSKGRIWISAYNGGLNLFDEKTKSFKHFKSSKSGLSSDRILYTFESSDGNIWICTLDGGVNKFNPENNNFQTFLHKKNDPRSIGQSSVWTGSEDIKKRIWFGLRTEGICLYDPKTNYFQTYKNTNVSENGLVSNSVICTFIDSKNRLFIGTSLGLNYVELDKLEAYVPKNISFELINEGNLEGAGINYITEDKLGNIWIASDYGVYKLNTNLKLVKSYSSNNGLPNNLVIGIKEDNQNKIWITTKGGLSMLDPKTDNFKNFNVHDGIQGPEFQTKSIEKTKNGRIIVGGINGFNIFHPSDIKTTVTDTLHPLITKFKLNNKVVSAGDTINGRILLNKGISKTRDLTLKYDENYISFEIVALHFDNSEQVKYAYRMKGLDNEFIALGSNRVVNLSNLEFGNYTFEVKASLTGDWDSAETTFLNIEITPPIWRTWWAYLIYFILGSLLLWAIVHYYTLKIREDQQHELDQKQLEFFMNVSHEFRTPLTLILNPVNKILNNYRNDPQVIKESATSIQRSARRLMHLVNQLLDYRKMDVGMYPMQLEKGDIVKFSKEIYSLFKDLALKKNIQYTFISSAESINCLFDFDKVEKIITNLISNAIKFTNSEGSILVSVERVKHTASNSKLALFKKKELTDYILISVEDTGIGLDTDQKQNIFSRFYSIDKTKSGTGIGLNFTKGLVELHGGEIAIDSKRQKGTKFTVKLPYDIKSKPKNVENVKNEYLINSMRAVEYDMLISNDATTDNTDVKKPRLIINEKLPVVLIVEDNKELRLHLTNDLKDSYQIKEAVNGEEGLKMIAKHYPDIVISDVMMPKMDGFEMCKLMKTDLETSHIPIILLTARTLEEDRIEGYENGADGYLSKPFSIEVLRSRINNLLVAKDRLRQRFSEIGGVFPSKEVTTNNIDEAFLDKATRIVMKNISDLDFKQEDLLKDMHLGRSQFYRKINALTGNNPSHFIRTIRLRYASELLLKNEYSIKEITYMAGFNSTAYFSKTFRELFNLTPTQYIEQAAKPEEA